MNFFKYFLPILAITLASANRPQPTRDWNGKACAVVLTYDDALDGHLDRVIPALNKYNFKGTFYLIASASAVSNRLPEWRAAAANGHELGNHTLYHPCDGALPGRGFVKPATNLANYTVARAVSEIRVSNTLLKAIDGKTERTFAYPCGDKTIHDTIFYNQVKNEFVAARGTTPGYPKIKDIDLDDVNAFSANGATAETMIAQVEEAERQGSVVVFLFHGVGGGHALNTDETEHNKLLAYLKKREKDVWVVPMLEAGRYIKQKQGQ